MNRLHLASQIRPVAAPVSASIAVCLFVGLLGVGCANLSSRPGTPDTTALPRETTTPERAALDLETVQRLNRLLPADALPGEFLIQQTVTIRWLAPDGPGEATFEAALQRTEDKLLLVGFGPMQRVGFELWLEDGGVRFENRTGREMPFRPEDIIADVQRVFYPWLASETTCQTCERKGARLDLEFEERFRDDLLAERVFWLRNRRELGATRLAYSGERLFGVIPKQCEVTNEWFGYTLSIDSQRFERIRPFPRSPKSSRP